MLTGDNAVYALRDRQLGLRERSQQVLAGVSQAMNGMGSLESVETYAAERAAEATQEQSTGIDQINQAIAQLDQVTQQNASLVQEASSVSLSLDERANDMHVLVGRFKVSDSAYSEDDATDDSASPKALPAT